MKNFRLNKNTALALKAHLRALDWTKEYRVSVTEWKDSRSDDQRALQHVFYRDISNEFGWDIRYTTGYCKLYFGVPIIMKNELKSAMLQGLFIKYNFYGMCEEEQIQLLAGAPLTSLFDTKENKEYLDAMNLHFGQYGLILVSSNDK